MARALRNKPGFHLLARFLNSPSPGFLGSLRWLETIAYEEVRVSTERPYNSTAFVVHGLLGSGRNWRSFSRNLAATLSNSSSSSGILILFFVFCYLLLFFFSFGCSGNRKKMKLKILWLNFTNYDPISCLLRASPFP